MKILFLDIDGVVNCATTSQRHRGVIGIDPYMAILVDRIVQATGCEIVLSSTWRLWEDERQEVAKQVGVFIDVTPRMPVGGGAEMCERGYEIRAWLEANRFKQCRDRNTCHEPFILGSDHKHKITSYAILDDNSDMLPEQLPNFFKTEWKVGLTKEIANQVIAHLNSEKPQEKTGIYLPSNW